MSRVCSPLTIPGRGASVQHHFRMHWQTWVEHIGEAIDVLGVVVMVLGLLFALGRYIVRTAKGDRGLVSYRSLRSDTGRSILLGLEFLVAGDIIRTVATSPTFTQVGILAIIVAIRSFLSFTLELEVTGRWPWQRAADPVEA